VTFNRFTNLTFDDGLIISLKQETRLLIKDRLLSTFNKLFSLTSRYKSTKVFDWTPGRLTMFRAISDCVRVYFRNNKEH